MSDPAADTVLRAPVRLPQAVALAVLGALLHQVAVYAPALDILAGEASFSRSILSFTDGIRATLPHLAATLLGLVGAFLLVRRRALAAGLLVGAGTTSLVTFTIAVRGAWWAASAGGLPIRAGVGLYLGLASAALLLAAAVLGLRGVVGGGRTLPAAVLAGFLLGAWAIPWLAWGAVVQPPSGLDVGPVAWLGRAMVATAFLAVALAAAAWHLDRSPVRGRGLGTVAALAAVLLVAGIVAGWSLVRILHAAAWGSVAAVAALCLVALVSVVARPTVAGGLAIAGLGLLLAGLFVPVLEIDPGTTFRPIPLGDVPTADVLPNAVNEIPPIALAALGAALLRHRSLAGGLLLAAVVAAIPWSLLFPQEGIEIGMWLRIAGLVSVLAAAWLLLATSERPGSEPPSPR